MELSRQPLVGGLVVVRVCHEHEIMQTRLVNSCEAEVNFDQLFVVHVHSTRLCCNLKLQTKALLSIRFSYSALV